MNLDDTMETFYSIRSEAGSWPDSMFNETHRILNKYYKIDVDNDMLREIASNDGVLAKEIRDDSIGDTYARDLLIDALLAKLNIEAWPCNGDSKLYKEEFKVKLYKAATEGLLKILD